MNYLPCIKCNSSSNIIKIDYSDKDNCLYLKLSCVKKCSTNYIKFSDLINLLKNQNKVQMSILVYGNYSKEQKKIENISEKLINCYNKILSNFEIIEKNIIAFKEEITNEIKKIKAINESLQILNELIFGSYLKNIKDNLDKDNNSYLKNNLKFININNSSDNFRNNFYLQQIEDDISKINNSFNYIKKEFSLFTKTNPFEPINLFPKIFDNIPKNKEKHDIIETYQTTIKDIRSIILLSDGNLALGSESQLIIYNLKLNKEIEYIPGEFNDIREINFSKKYKTNNNNIIIMSILDLSIKIYNVKEKTLLLNYVQNSSIDNVLELYNGDILYINDYAIYNIGLNKEFKIPLSYFCFSMINLYEKQNILGYTYKRYIKFIYLDNPKKVYKKIEINDAEEIFDVKQIYNENKNYNFLIILSTHKIDLYDLNNNIFMIYFDMFKSNIYKKIIFNFNFNEENIFIIGENSIKLFAYKNNNENKLMNIQNINNLKNINSPIYSKIIATPFCFNKDGKYILIFESNDEGFNTL